ncbi:MAG: Dipeptidyl aminopeptidase/acylaminoacyl-peptidase-like [Firmicutes bacterium]|nr:Dipeptidyl aminopeptidase/acylaminoacyl-peptidase-like [Bacillota bacterium]
MKKIARWSFVLIGALILWASITNNPTVWPIRNTLEYKATRLWWAVVGEPDVSRSGSVAGKVTTVSGQAVGNAVVLISEWDGRVRTAHTDASGQYRIAAAPMGFYRMAATAPGYEPVQTGGILRGVTVRPGCQVNASFQLKQPEQNLMEPLPSPRILDTQTLVCKSPVPGEARRETLDFSAAGLNELIFLYRPSDSMEKTLPVLLTVYPGPVDTWECVSIGLAQAGYAVLAIGPAYGLELTRDVDTLERLVKMVKTGGLPGGDSARVGALGGSYSALLLELLMVRDSGLEAVVLLGPPTDMYDFRRRFEREGFVPPFGLDRALVALGLPSREPLRYLNHSMVYQVRRGMPATILFHSYQDEIVPYQQSGLLAQSLREQGVEAELHLFDGASHYLLDDNEASMTIYHKTIDFLRRHGMAPFPGKEK